MSEWIFDQLPASGSVQGAPPSAYGLGPVNLDTFVREVLQNARDQRISQLAQVDFSFYRFDGTKKQRFLESIDWERLEQHLFGVAEGAGPWGSQWDDCMGTKMKLGKRTVEIKTSESGTDIFFSGIDPDSKVRINKGFFIEKLKDVVLPAQLLETSLPKTKVAQEGPTTPPR